MNPHRDYSSIDLACRCKIVLSKYGGMWLLNLSFDLFDADEKYAYEPGEIFVATWGVNMPFTKSCLPDIVQVWLNNGAKEPLTQKDIATMCFDRAWEEAWSDNRAWDKRRTLSYGLALQGQ